MVRVKNQPLRVISVLASKGGSGFGSVDDRACVPISLAQQRLFGAHTPDGNSYRVGSISLSAKNSADLNAIQACGPTQTDRRALVRVVENVSGPSCWSDPCRL
jgi:MacB-like periplasmic core domain